MTRASYLLRHGNDPTSAIEAARSFFRKSAEASPWDVDYRVDQARTEALALRWAISKGRADAALFDAAFAPLSSVLDKERVNPHVYQALSENRWLPVSSRAGGGCPARARRQELVGKKLPARVCRQEFAERSGSRGASLTIHP